MNRNLALRAAACLWAASAALFLAPGRADTPWTAVISPDNSLDFRFYKDGRAVFSEDMAGWGPGWAWRLVGAGQRARGGALDAATTFESNKDAGQVIALRLHAAPAGPDTLTYQFTLSADRDVPLTELAAGFATDPAFRDGQAVVTQSDGKTVTLPLSLGVINEVPAARQIAFGSRDAGTYTLTLDPPCPLHIDNGLRVLLARDSFPQGTRTVTLTLHFPQPVTLLASDADIARLTQVLPGPDWYPFTPKNDAGPSALGFENWLDKPAGRHGGVRLANGHFAFADGIPIKFWGVNLAYAASAPDKSVAPAMAARLAKWGVNAVRMHKFTGSGWAGIGDPNDATKMDPAGLDRLDFFAAQLARDGVYYGWSHTYGFTPGPANRNQLLAYDEIKNNLGGNTYGLINCAEDVQNLLIQRVVNLLHHRNPYTGKTYAQDPALCYLELQNEDDIFFYSTQGALDKCPTYKRHFTARWCDWLRAKYGSTAALRAAWADALHGDETLEAQNVALQMNPWFFGEDNLPHQTGGQRRRLLDNAAFLHDAQDQFYTRFTQAIRAAGYHGPIVGSPWQAPAMLPHFLNLNSDAKAGYVDRHDYFGGGLLDTMMGQPGGGSLSSGLQQVAGRPFGLSEWIHVYPSLYSAEGPALMAAYGMGLQGWDASYEFQSASGAAAFTDTVGNFPYGVWNTDVPTQIGQYPLLARMIARGDVREGPVISVRRVSRRDLTDGTFHFTDKVQQQGDIKTFGGSVPAAALAAGRCLVQFTPTSQPSTFPAMSQYRHGPVTRSNTGQLAWDTSGQGCVTINTPGTRGVVGFAGNRQFTLGDVHVRMESPYASLLLTAADRGTTLTTAKSALISAMARNANTGFSYFTPDHRVLDNGKAPILMEPVRATLTFTARRIAAVNVLDHDGRHTGRTLPVHGGAFTLDGRADKTPFYEVVFAGK